MPTYDYICPNGHPYSETRSMADSQVRETCPKPDCNLQLNRVWRTPTITFKGRGFYSTGG